MSEAYAGGGEEQARAGGIILVAVSVLAAVLVLLGLIYAAGTGARHKVALAAAGCEPNLSPSGLQCTTYQMLTSQYMTTVTPVTQQLNTDMAEYTATERHNLAAAETALKGEVTSEHSFDASLATFPFPPVVAPIATALVQANRARANLIAEQARSSSLTQLRSFNHRVEVASAAAQTEMNLVRKALGTPPTVNQEP